MGEKSLSNQLKERLKIVGLSHVVVASGFCLSILVEFARKIAGKLSRFAGYFFAFVLISVFIIMTGFSPSLIRAGIVSVVSLFASYYGRKFHPGRLLVYAAALSVLIRPTLIADLAWQLSFLSFAGILLITPVLQAYFYGKKPPGWLASMVFATISAQLACLPLSVYTFGQFSIISLVTNILITPLIPIIMVLTFIISICQFRFLPLVFINQLFLSYQNSVIGWFSDIKWATVNVPPKIPFVFLAYIPIILIIYALKRRTAYSYRPELALDKSPKYGKIYSC